MLDSTDVIESEFIYVDHCIHLFLYCASVRAFFVLKILSMLCMMRDFKMAEKINSDILPLKLSLVPQHRVHTI